MFKWIRVIFLILLSLFSEEQVKGNSSSSDFIQGQIFFKIGENDNNFFQENGSQLQQLRSKFSIDTIYCPFILDDVKLQSTYLVEFRDTSSINELLKQVEEFKGVEYVEKVPLYHHFYTPNDLASQQWGLPQIQAEQAWDIEQGDPNIKVAIVDDAVLTSHEDLTNEIWTNPGEIPGNNTDDDGNGYVDDVNGWDAADNDNDPSPPASATNSNFTHGTHVAGIAGAETDNGIGMSSIGFGVSIMPVKIADDASGGLTAGVQGVQYAIAAEADVINMSWGGPNYSQTYQNLFNTAHSRGIVLVAAAGNNNTSQFMYPASNNHVISVGATDQSDNKAIFSNYGPSIDVMAPGTDIYSCLAGSNSSYGQLQGTSMASPMVAGLAGLMLSRNPSLHPDSLEKCLEDESVDISSQNPGYVGELGAGRINAFDALSCAQLIYADFSSSLTWVCPGDSVQFIDESTNNPTSWDWTFNGGNPSSSTTQNPWVTYPTPGVYDVKLVVTNSQGTDSIVRSNYITVSPPTGNLSGSTSIVLGNTAFLQLTLQGNPPWDVTYTNGVDTFSVNNIGSSPYFLGVSPDSTTTYELIEVEDQYCTGPGSGTATVTVTLGCNKGGNAFQNHFGSTSFWEKGHDIVEASNKDLLVAGTTNQGTGGKDIFVARFDSLGNRIWSKTYGNSADEGGLRVGVAKDGMGNFFVSGRTSSYGGNMELFVFKIDGNGNIVWEKYLGGSDKEQGRGIHAMDDGGVVVIGEAKSSFASGGGDAYLVKFDSTGNMEWNKTYGKGGADHVTTVDPFFDNGFVMGFHQWSYGAALVSTAITRVDSVGNIIWQKYFDDVDKQAIVGISVTPDSSIVAVGGWTATLGMKDIMVYKVDKNGNLLWSKALGGSNDDRGHDVFVDSGGDIFVSGKTSSFGNGEEVFLMKMDPAGTQKWVRLIGGSGDQGKVKFGGGMVRTQDGAFALAGYTYAETGEQQGYLLKTNRCQNVGCKQRDTIFSVSSASLSPGVTNWDTSSGGNLSNTSWNVGNMNAPSDSICSFDSPIITCALKADFQALPVCIGDSTRFQDQSYDFAGNNVVSWEWRFGDGDTLVGVQDPVHLYSTADTFQVELIAGSQDTSGNCFDTIVKPVLVLDTLTAFLPDTDTICYGDSLQLGPPHLVCGAPSYDYSWSPNSSITNDTIASPVAFPDTTTEYIVEVVDSLGAISYDTVKIVVDTNCCVSHASFSGDSVYCMGDSVLFQNNSVVSGANPTYEWDFGPDASPSSYTGPNPPKVSFDTVGFHDIQLILSDSCGSDTAFGTVSFSPLPVADAGKDTTVCIGDSVLIGDTPLAWHSYSWTPTVGLDDPASASPKAGVDSSITYYMETINSQTGCSTEDTIHLTTVDTPQFDLGPDTALCQGDSLVLSVADTTATFSWNDGSTDSSLTTDTTGTYWVDVTNACGTYSDTLDLVIEPVPVADLGPDTLVCTGDTLVLDASHPGGGSYQWNTGASSDTLAVDTGGTYWVVVDNPSCPADTDTVVVQNPQPPVVDLGPDTLICQGDSLLLDGTWPNSTYLWQDGSTDSTLTATTTGTYWAEVTNVCGTTSDTMDLLTINSPIADAGPDSAVCVGDSLLLSAAGSMNDSSLVWNTGQTGDTLVVDTGGVFWVVADNPTCPSDTDSVDVLGITVPPVDLGPDTTFCGTDSVLLDATYPYTSYSWQDGSSDSAIWADTTGTYWVVATDPCGTASDTVEIVTVPLPNVQLRPDTTTCTGDTLVLEPTASGDSTYQWNDGSTADTLLTDSAGTYWAEVDNPQCPSSRDSISISQILPPNVDLGNDTSLCQGDSITLDASDSLISGYQWHDGSTDPTYTTTSGGEVTVSVSNLCTTDADTVQVNVLTSPAITIEPDTSICDGDSLLLTARGTDIDQVIWNNGLTDTSRWITSPGIYWAEGFNDVCPSYRDSIEIEEKGPPKVYLGTDTVICEGASLTLDAGPAMDHTWQDSSATRTLSVKDSGLYWVRATNTCGSDRDSIVVEMEDCECEFSIPNVFTPNGDRKNDVFRVDVRTDCEVTGFKVFNRWGEVVYEQSMGNPVWHGRNGAGAESPEGTYYYLVEVEGESYQGTIMLMK